MTVEVLDVTAPQTTGATGVHAMLSNVSPLGAAAYLIFGIHGSAQHLQGEAPSQPYAVFVPY